MPERNRSDFRGPDFIGIGVAKAGTSWLDSMLRVHPEIWLPNLKELHFLDDYYRLVVPGYPSRYFSPDPYSRRRWRRYLITELKRMLRFPSPGNFVWTIRFLFLSRTIDNYKRLFPSSGLVRGEVTPDYCVLDRVVVETIRSHFPNLRVILLLRNPVERAWSHARMELAGRKKRDVSEIELQELERFLFEDRGVARRGHYKQILRNWGDVFGDDLFVGLYDDLRDRPSQLLRNVCVFLGVQEWQWPAAKTAERVFEGQKATLDSELRARLRKQYDRDVRAVAEYTGRSELLDLWR